MLEPGKNHPILINTLPREEYDKRHIPGSISIPVDQLPQQAKQLFSKHDWLVVYCANTSCPTSTKAAETLMKQGFSNVFKFEGGIEEWQSQNKYTNTETGGKISKVA